MIEINLPLSSFNYRSPRDDPVNGLNHGVENESWALVYNCFQSCLNRSEFTRSRRLIGKFILLLKRNCREISLVELGGN